MSAQSISRIWTVLDERKDNAHLILELIGSYSLGLFATPAPTPATQSLTGTRDIGRQLLVRLKVVVDHHLQSLALRDIGAHVPFPLILPRDLSFELFVNIISIANWIYPPATLGNIQYALHRGLYFTVLQTAFRCLSLYREPLELHEADTIRQRLHQMCQTWDDHQPLSATEALVLRHILPQTIDELQQRPDDIRLGGFFCRRFSLGEYQQCRSPMCPDPGNPYYRAASFQICQDTLLATLEGLQESNWVEACWTLHDVGYSLAASSIRRFSSSSLQPHSSDNNLVETSSAALWETVKRLQQSLDPAMRNALLCNYFSEIIARISGHNWSLLPSNLTPSEDLTQCLEFEVLNFDAYIDARNQLLSQQYSESRTRAWVVSDSSDRGGGAPLGPMPSPGPSVISGPIPYRGPAQRPSREPTAQPSPTGGHQHGNLRSATATPAHQGESDHGEQAVRKNSGNQLQPAGKLFQDQEEDQATQAYQPFRHDRNSGSTGPRSHVSDERGNFSPAPSRSAGAQTPWSESEGSIRTNNHLLGGRIHETIQEPSPTPSEYGIHPTASSLGSRPETANTNRPVKVAPPPSTYEGSIAPSSTKTSKSRKWGGLNFAASIMSRERPSRTSMPVAKDLGFCFSSVSTSLLIWEIKNAEYIVRLFWPFRDGQKLKLRSFSHNNPVEDGAGTWTVKLVEGGNSVAAAVVSVNNSYKLLYFDGKGSRHEIPIPRPELIPISLAVSRDDTMIALGCGTVVFLFAINTEDGTHRLLSEVPSHSRPRARIGNRRRQRLNFSPDSSALIAATQEPMNPEEKISNTNSGQDTQVHICLWRFNPSDSSRTPRLEAELHDVFLSLGRGNDPGLTSISVSLAPTVRIFMTALSFQNYSWILIPGGTGHKRIPLTERRISSVAQSSLQAQGGSLMVFKSGAHEIVTVDMRTGVTSPLISFAQERGNLKMGQDGMVVAFAPNNNGDNVRGGLVMAFWKGWEGQLVLKQVEIGSSSGMGDGGGQGGGSGGSGSGSGGKGAAVVAGEELQAVYWYVVSRG
ncbi:hypothetical protein QBC38DRAFT_486317 [Podospora fimiseda]|uniref:Uncharacterized protein n=1 Tax=Podospora fimiseda TaxID=252190 RepID=A0AAN7GPY3_9PEZI|nr:hypothetical protein QBC38DRAFT_486317 [Podospora fimiseda]